MVPPFGKCKVLVGGLRKMQLDSISCFEEDTLSPIDVDRQWLEENMVYLRLLYGLIVSDSTQCHWLMVDSDLGWINL